MEIKLNVKNMENVGDWTIDKQKKAEEVFIALIQTGGLTGVKGGQTIIHWDGDGNFMGINLNYWPWRKRRKEG